MSESRKWELTKEQQLELIANLTAELAPLRAKVGISQGELASIIGVSRQTYSSIECGKKTMSWSTYLSLILFFDYNSSTHQMLRNINAFPEDLIKKFNSGKTNPYEASLGLAGIPDSIADKLDEKAFHAIRTVIMVEYARCAEISGENVVKTFGGKIFADGFDQSDIAIRKSIKNIRKGQ